MPTDAPIPDDVMEAAKSQCDLCGITPTSDMRVHAEHVAAFSIIAERSRNEERIAELERALRNLAHEMRFLLRNNPKMDGGLYRQRLTEAETLLPLACPHNCDLGGVCLADHAGFSESCARAALGGKADA